MNVRAALGRLVLGAVIVLGTGCFLTAGSRVDTRETANGDPYRLVSVERPTEMGTLTQTLEIGLDDGPEIYRFGLIRDIAVGSDGTVVVSDQEPEVRSRGTPPGVNMSAGRVRLYDRSGVFLRNIGRLGDGPGEYRGPFSLLVAEDGRVLVCHNGGVTAYSSEGELEYSVRLKLGIGLGFCTLTGKEDGGAIVSVRSLRGTDVLWLSSRGEVVDSFAVPKPRIVVDGNLTRSVMVFIYSPGLTSDWAPDGTRVSVWTEDFAIEVDRAPRETTVPGNALTLITMDVDRIPLPIDERAQLMDAIRSIHPGEPVEEIVATHKPPIADQILVGEDGRVWLRGSTPSIQVDDQDRVYRAGAGVGVAAEGWGEQGVFYVLSPDGSSVGAFRPPFPITPMFARGDTVWAHYESEAGAPKVGRFTVTW